MKTDPRLLELLTSARALPPMTKEQIAAQRQSWVIGEMMIEHPEMTHDQAARIYDDICP